MQEIVEELLKHEGIVGSFLVGKDGLIVANPLLDEGDAEIFGALSAAMFGELDKATKHLGIGALVTTTIDTQEGSVILLEVNDLILVVVTQKTKDLSLVKAEMQLAAERIIAAVTMEII